MYTCTYLYIYLYNYLYLYFYIYTYTYAVQVQRRLRVVVCHRDMYVIERLETRDKRQETGDNDCL